MKIEFKCSVCKKMSNEPGALLFSPPDSNGQCSKYHICTGCFSKFYIAEKLINFSDKISTLFDDFDSIEIGTEVQVIDKIEDRDYREESNIKRKRFVGQRGKVILEHNSHGLCYEVRFLHGIASYDPDELLIIVKQ